MLEAGGAGGSYTGTARKTASLNAKTNNNYSSSVGALTQPGVTGLNAVTKKPTGSGVLAVYANDPAVQANPAAAATSTYGTSSSGGSSGGGGGGSTAAAASPSLGVVAKIPSLSDYISKNYLLTTTDAENSRKLSDYDAESLAGQEDTEADRDKRLFYLDQDLDRQGIDSAESFASRGLGRSGLVYQAQDKIDASGEKSADSIKQLVTDYIKGRQSGRLQQQASNRAARASVIQQLTDAYNTAVGNGTADQLTTLSS